MAAPFFIQPTPDPALLSLILHPTEIIHPFITVRSDPLNRTQRWLHLRQKDLLPVCEKMLIINSISKPENSRRQKQSQPYHSKNHEHFIRQRQRQPPIYPEP